jgi:hypothetical protein
VSYGDIRPREALPAGEVTFAVASPIATELFGEATARCWISCNCPRCVKVLLTVLKSMEPLNSGTSFLLELLPAHPHAFDAMPVPAHGGSVSLRPPGPVPPPNGNVHG